jgi:hypothetical protein
LGSFKKLADYFWHAAGFQDGGERVPEKALRWGWLASEFQEKCKQ